MNPFVPFFVPSFVNLVVCDFGSRHPPQLHSYKYSRLEGRTSFSIALSVDNRRLMRTCMDIR